MAVLLVCRLCRHYPSRSPTSKPQPPRSLPGPHLTPFPSPLILLQTNFAPIWPVMMTKTWGRYSTEPAWPDSGFSLSVAPSPPPATSSPFSYIAGLFFELQIQKIRPTFCGTITSLSSVDLDLLEQRKPRRKKIRPTHGGMSEVPRSPSTPSLWHKSVAESNKFVLRLLPSRLKPKGRAFALILVPLGSTSSSFPLCGTNLVPLGSTFSNLEVRSVECGASSSNEV